MGRRGDGRRVSTRQSARQNIDSLPKNSVGVWRSLVVVVVGGKAGTSIRNWGSHYAKHAVSILQSASNHMKIIHKIATFHCPGPVILWVSL